MKNIILPWTGLDCRSSTWLKKSFASVKRKLKRGFVIPQIHKLFRDDMFKNAIQGDEKRD
jgi:hypothetical protein